MSKTGTMELGKVVRLLSSLENCVFPNCIFFPFLQKPAKAFFRMAGGKTILGETDEEFQALQEKETKECVPSDLG